MTSADLIVSFLIGFVIGVVNASISFIAGRRYGRDETKRLFSAWLNRQPDADELLARINLEVEAERVFDGDLDRRLT